MKVAIQFAHFHIIPFIAKQLSIIGNFAHYLPRFQATVSHFVIRTSVPLILLVSQNTRYCCESNNNDCAVVKLRVINRAKPDESNLHSIEGLLLRFCTQPQIATSALHYFRIIINHSAFENYLRAKGLFFSGAKKNPHNHLRLVKS